MLSTLFSGLRHLRVPLTAGAAWMLVAWLVIGPDVLLPDGQTVLEQRTRELIGIAGPALVVAALGIVAAVIGDAVPAPQVSNLRALFDRKNLFSREKELNEHLQEWARLRSEMWAGLIRWDDVLDARAPLSLRKGANAALEGPLGNFRTSPMPSNELHAVLDMTLGGELGHFNTQLDGANDVLREDYEREMSEGDLRMALVAPTAVLAGWAAYEMSAWWAVALILPSTLLWRGWVHQKGARVILYRALANDQLKSPAAEYLAGIVASFDFEADRRALGKQTRRSRWRQFWSQLLTCQN